MCCSNKTLWHKAFPKDLTVPWFLEWGCKLFHFSIAVASHKHKINLRKTEIFSSALKDTLATASFINFSNYHSNISNMERYIYKRFYGHAAKAVTWALNFFLQMLQLLHSRCSSDNRCRVGARASHALLSQPNSTAEENKINAYVKLDQIIILYTNLTSTII